MSNEKTLIAGGVSWQRYNLLVERAYDKAFGRAEEGQVLATLALAEATILSAAPRAPRA
jgi:hypothetical protein